MTSQELTIEEQEALTKDLTEVLEKHNCDLSVVASMQILKREEPKEEDNGDTKEETPTVD